MIDEAIMSIAEDGAMPSSADMNRKTRSSALACVVVRTGGFVYWAMRLGLRQRRSETSIGLRAEMDSARYLNASGYDPVSQHHSAAFDLLVGTVRIDVKSAHFTSYTNSRNGCTTEGFVFILGGVRRCDLFLLCGLNEHDETMWRYFLPSNATRARTVTITPSGLYSVFKNDINQLDQLLRVA